MATQPAIAQYNKRPVPAGYDKGFFDVEMGIIQRSIKIIQARTVTASTTMNVTDDLVLCNPAAGAISYTLLDPARALNGVVTIKQITSNAHAVTLVGTIDGSASPVLGGINKSVTIQSDGVAWWKIGEVT